MTQCYDTLDSHLAAAPDIAAAGVPMGMMLAWCVQMQLLAPDVIQAHEQLIMRIRYREIMGTPLLMACGGDLRRDLFSSRGQAFLDAYYDTYLEDYAAAFDCALYEVPDNWDSYARLAPLITRAFMGRETTGAPGEGGLADSLRRLFKRSSK